MIASVPYSVARAWLRKIAAELQLEPANIARQAGLSTTVLTNCYYSDDDDKRRIRLKTLRTVAQKFNKPLGEIDPGGRTHRPRRRLGGRYRIGREGFCGGAGDAAISGPARPSNPGSTGRSDPSFPDEIVARSSIACIRSAPSPRGRPANAFHLISHAPISAVRAPITSPLR